MIVIAMVALLLTFTVSGTIAWLAASTDEVVNTFTPGKVKTDIDEEIENGVKTKIVIRNEKEPNSTVPVFVRVSVSGYYVKDTKDSSGTVTGQVIVEQWNGLADTQINAPDWFKGADGFYYYTKSIKPGESTSNLLKSGVDLTQRTDGTYLVVNVIHQSIQYKPETAVESVWPVEATVSNGSGTITATN